MLSEFPVRAQQWRVFATAHSRGLRLASAAAAFARLVFATAHSCGLRLDVNAACVCGQSLPQRIRAGCDAFRGKLPKGANLCHSAFARVATQQTHQCLQFRHALPQRIRAGCDVLKRLHRVHGRSLPQRIRAGCDFHRVPFNDSPAALPQRIRAGCDYTLRVCRCNSGLCHSAFVRVATGRKAKTVRAADFATAHSCGLRPAAVGAALFTGFFATAHSCGLRRWR